MQEERCNLLKLPSNKLWAEWTHHVTLFTKEYSQQCECVHAPDFHHMILLQWLINSEEVMQIELYTDLRTAHSANVLMAIDEK